MKSLYFVRSLVLGALISLPMTLMADTDHKAIEKLVSELADRPEHHQAIASYYKAKSEEAKKELEQHRAMNKAYFGTGKNQASTEGMRAHCSTLIKAYESAVTEYDQLAKEHENEASKFGKKLPQ